jgi:hypothetical protein
MMSFVLVPSPYEDIPETLKAVVPEFAASDEYRMLLGNAEELPGVVLASFARFLARLARGSPSDPILAKGIAVVTQLWGWNDPQTKDALADEFFQALDSEADTAPIIVRLMQPQMREAYSIWAARPF